MTAVALPDTAVPTVAFDLAALAREAPDTSLAARFDGEPMVQSFRVALPGDAIGRCWITTADALRVPAFGRAWVAGQLEGRAATLGWETVLAQLVSASGLRLDA
jgi:hypothetical protein